MAKPRKVEEPAGTYLTPAKQRTKAGSNLKPAVRYLENSPAEKLAEQIFLERKNLLHKLAQ